MSQVLGEFGLLNFTMLRPVLAWPRFETDELFISLRDCIKEITDTVDTELADMGAQLYDGSRSS
jgi:hypothetical protein